MYAARLELFSLLSRARCSYSLTPYTSSETRTYFSGLSQYNLKQVHAACKKRRLCGGEIWLLRRARHIRTSALVQPIYGATFTRARARSCRVAVVAAAKSARVGLFDRRKPRVIIRPRALTRCGASSEYKAKLIFPGGLRAPPPLAHGSCGTTRIMTYVYPGNIKER